MIRLLLIGLLLAGNLQAQTDLIVSLPILPEVLKKNKVQTMKIHERQDSSMYLTHSYFLDTEGKVTAHYNYDPANEGGGPFDVEFVRRSEDTIGFVHYTRGIYAEDGSRINLLADHQYYFSSTGKLKKMIYHDFMDYQIIRMSVFDTLHVDYKDKYEWKLFNEDTMYWIKDFQNDTRAEHVVKNKVNGKWIETEKSLTTLKNGEVETYVLYKNGKIVKQYDAQKEEGLKKGKDVEEGEFPLPISEPMRRIYYSDKMDLILKSDAIEKKAKFEIHVYFEGNDDSDFKSISYFEIYDKQNDLLLVKSDREGKYRTEYYYIFRK